ncbi:MAG: dgoA protein [Planctomycetota bacterium]|nr:dgoA protein [Planctomycetota bacterium]
MYSRRHLLRTAAWGTAGLGLSLATRAAEACSDVLAGAAEQPFQVDRVDRVTVRLPYREIPRRAMDRELPHWRYSEVFEVRLRSGEIGWGETLLYYTWGVSTDDDVKRALGKNAVDLMWDESLGAGLQIALFDAVARTAGVPVHRLLGRQVNERTPLSWWNIDTPPEDMAAECREAHRQGYLSYKTKGRPWFDVWKQVEMAAKAVPESFKIDMDFNSTLRDADRAIPILRDLEKYPQVDIYESPIPQSDVPGNREIREATRVNIAMHYGTPRPAVVVKEGVCDGFVVGGGARRVLQAGHFAGEVDMPFWLQLVGTGITAAYSLHFGAVLSHARWPAVNCHQLYQHTLLTQPIRVEKGSAAVPRGPGLGYEVDPKALQRYRVEKPSRRPDPERLVETRWPDGRRMVFASGGRVNFLLDAANQGKIPFYVRGVTTKLVPNDGSARWRELYEKAHPDPYRIE